MPNQPQNLINSLLSNPRLRLIVIRYVTTAWIALELFLYAKLLGPQEFGQYALTVQLVSFLTLVGAGSGMGYVYAYYSQKNTSIDDIYQLGASVQYLGGCIALLLITLYTKSYFLISCLVLSLKIPYLISEPMLRVRNIFTLPAIGRASGSIATSLLLGAYLLLNCLQIYDVNDKITLNLAINIMIAGNVLGHLIYYIILHFTKAYRFEISIPTVARLISILKKYWRTIIAPSLLYTLSSVAFVSFTFIDRLFLENFYPKTALSSYSLAWQISQSVLLILTSLNLVSGVRIGEYQQEEHQKRFEMANKQLMISVKASLVAMIIASTGAWILSISLYQEYENLFFVSTFLSLGYLCFGIAGSITMVIYFENRLIEIFMSYSFLILASLTANIVAVQWGLSYFVPLIVSSSGLILVSIYLILRYFSISLKTAKNV